jgi:dihydroorotase
MIARDIALTQRAGGRLHIAHLSTAGSVALVRHAKQQGLAVTAEVAPHHFTLTDEAVAAYDTNAKMKPPLRTAEDVAAVIDGLREGVIDAIATDHAPHHRDEKDVEFEAAANGIVGLETALPLALRLTREAQVPVDVVIRALSANPARILGVAGGSLAVESSADVTIIDPTAEWQVEPDRLASKSRNTPFGGWSMTGRAVCTIVGGRIAWRAEAADGAARARLSAAR